MQITEISVEYKRTFNLGNFESVTLSERIVATFDENDDIDLCNQELFDMCKAKVKANIPPNYKPGA
jgi:predicted Zn-dependent protease with MMP-like domain